MAEITDAMIGKSDLRRRLLSQRRTISDSDQKQASAGLTKQLLQQDVLQQARHIALYWPIAQEISPLALMQVHNCYFYYPVVQDNGKLVFKLYQENMPLQPNQYGIPEPNGDNATIIRVSDLDIIVMPAVAVDRQGNRLGMGKGYYDKTLEHQVVKEKHPLFIGAVYDFQILQQVPAARHDITLDAVATETQFFGCQTKLS